MLPYHILFMNFLNKGDGDIINPRWTSIWVTARFALSLIDSDVTSSSDGYAAISLYHGSSESQTHTCGIIGSKC
jgi:hypothetical protein